MGVVEAKPTVPQSESIQPTRMLESAAKYVHPCLTKPPSPLYMEEITARGGLVQTPKMTSLEKDEISKTKKSQQTKIKTSGIILSESESNKKKNKAE